MPVFTGNQYFAAGGDAALRKRYAALQTVAASQSIRELPIGEPTDPGFFLKTIEFISRPLFAVEGVADVMMGTGRPGENVPSRILREMLGQGDKETFSQLLEQNGVGELGRLSNLIGENWVTRKWDPTARGAFGLALDIALDPLTYVTFGAGGGAQAISRGATVRLSKAGQRALTHTLDAKTARVARRLGQLRTASGPGGLKAAGGLKAVGESAERLWWEAVEAGGAKKGEMFLKLEAEAHERGLRMLQNVTDTGAHKTFLEDVIRKQSDDLLTKVLNTIGGKHPNLPRASADEVASVLKAAGVDTAEELIEQNSIRFMGKSLINIGPSGTLSRISKGMTDPFTKQFFGFLERHDSAREFYQHLAKSGKSLRDGVDSLFNRDKMGARQLGEYVQMKEELFNKLSSSKGDIERLVNDIFTDVWEPGYIRELAKFMDNPSRDAFRKLSVAGKRHNVSPERTQELVNSVRNQFFESGRRDVANNVLDAAAFMELADQYVPHMFKNWDILSEAERKAARNLFEEFSPTRSRVQSPTIGRFAEKRWFKTYDELEGFVAKLKEETGIVLDIDYDLPKLLAMRLNASHEAAHLTHFFNQVKAKFAFQHAVDQKPLLRAIFPQQHKTIRELMDSGALTNEQVREANGLLARSSTVAGSEEAKAAQALERQRAGALKPQRATKERLEREAQDLVEATPAEASRGAEAAVSAAGKREFAAGKATREASNKARAVQVEVKEIGAGLDDHVRNRADTLVNHHLRAIKAKNPELEVKIGAQGESVITAPRNLTKGDEVKISIALGEAKKDLAKEFGDARAKRLVNAVGRSIKRQAEFAEATVKEAGAVSSRKKLGAEAVRLSEEAFEQRARTQTMLSEAAELRRLAKDTKLGPGVTIDDVNTADQARLRALPEEAQAAFMYELLGNVKSLKHYKSILDKYEDIFERINPAALTKARKAAEDATIGARLSPYGGGGRLQAWKELEVPLQGGKLENWTLPEGIADDLRAWDKRWLQQEEVRGLLRIFDQMTNIFKMGVTVPFPAFHFRNSYSNIFQSALDITMQAFHPERHLEAMKIMAAMAGSDGNKLFAGGFGEGTLITALGRTYTYEHLAQLAKSYQIKVDFNALAEIIDGKLPMSRTSGRRTLRAMQQTLDVATKPGRFAGETIEGEARMMHWLTLIRRGLAPQDAALQMKRYLFDYSNLSGFERNIMRRVIPFYTWNSKNVRLQMHELVRRPGLINNLQKPFAQRDPQSDMLPEYVRGDLQMRLDPGPGKAASFLTGIDLPTTAIDVLFSGSLEKSMRNAIGLLNPLLKAPLELAFNEEAFTGQEIRGAQDMRKLGPLLANFPKPMREYFQLQKYEDGNGEERYLANGTRVYLVMKSWAVSRMMGTAAEVQRLWQNDEDLMDWWKLTTGLHFREYDFSEAQTKLLRARYERLEDEMIDRGLTLKWSSIYIRPDLTTKKRRASTGVFGG